MDNQWTDVAAGSSSALVILAFLQADCRDSELRRELRSLSNEINVPRDINANGPGIDPVEDGDLETDGHLPSSVSLSLQDIQPSLELQWPNAEAAANIQQVAEGLREIAAQLEENMLAQATRNLRRNIHDPSAEHWRKYLTLEVDQIMRHGTGLEHLPEQRVFMALTLTLVKGVFEQAPQLLRSLITAALQYIRA